MARPVAIEVRNVHKEFYIPGRGKASARERLTHPVASARGRQLHVLDDVSFDIQQGEFFGIVGRNGSGKSTLLKLIASIYRADRGTIRVAGRLAPFIELGVGFNPDLAAYDNVLMNAVMMGLTPRDARRRSEEIIAFAGLEAFTDLKLRNYSSGMRVRLGFSVMAHVDADVLLIDEVLAVGDAAFQEKSGNVFARMHEEGRTIVLVTHSMPSVNVFCDRAMLLHNGNVEAIGEGEMVANRYLELNAAQVLREATDVASSSDPAGRSSHGLLDGKRAQIVDISLEGSQNEVMPIVSQGDLLDLHAVVDVSVELHRPGFRFQVHDQTGKIVFIAPTREFGDLLRMSGEPVERFHVHATIENRLGTGPYMISCGVVQTGDEDTDALASRAKWLNFQVSGDGHRMNVVSLDHEIRVEPAGDREVSRT